MTFVKKNYDYMTCIKKEKLWLYDGVKKREREGNRHMTKHMWFAESLWICCWFILKIPGASQLQWIKLGYKFCSKKLIPLN